MKASEVPRQMADRGVWWHVVGFAIAGAICLVILEEFAGSDAMAYRYFETTIDRLYWALAVVLAGLIDRGRHMFETRMQIRRAARAKVREEGRREGRKEGRKEGRQEGRTEGREEGRTEGRQEGRTEGRQEGRQEGRRDVLDALRRHAVRDEATGRIVLELTPEVEAALLNGPDDRV